MVVVSTISVVVQPEICGDECILMSIFSEMGRNQPPIFCKYSKKAFVSQLQGSSEQGVYLQYILIYMSLLYIDHLCIYLDIFIYT